MNASAYDETIRKIYDLRREKKIFDACQLAENYCRSNQNHAGFIAFAWCVSSLYDLPEVDKEQYRQWFLQITSYILQNLNELGGRDFMAAHLKGSDCDAALARRLKFIVDDLTPKTPAQLMAEDAVKKSKAGDTQQACSLFERALKGGAQLSSYQQESYGWAIYKCLKTPDYPVNKAVPKLWAYLDLKEVEKPSNLNSMILVTADRYLRDNDFYDYAGFLERFDLDTLSPEDFKPALSKNSEGKTIVFEPLYDKVLRHAARVCIARLKNRRNVSGLPGLLKKIREYDDKALNRTLANAGEYQNEQEIWLCYYEARLLSALRQDLKRALTLSLHVARIKPQESWLWDFLAGLHEQTQTWDDAVKCCCKAMLCNNADTHALKKRLIRLLLNCGDEKTAAKLLFKILSQLPEGYEDRDLGQWQEQSWYLNCKKQGDLKSFEELKFYSQQALLADELIFDFVPWTEAVLGPELENKDHKKKRTLYVKVKFKDEHSAVSELPIPFKMTAPASRFAGQKQGTPVFVRLLPVNPSVSDKLTLCAAKPREGKKNDLLTAVTAAVNNVNRAKQLYGCIVKEGVETVLSFSEVNKPLSEGDEIGLQLYRFYLKKAEEVRLCVLKIQKADKPPLEKLTRQSDTVISSVLSSGPAFAQDDTFIPPSLTEAFALKRGDRVKLKAVKTFNRKHGRYGFKAYALEFAEGGEDEDDDLPWDED